MPSIATTALALSSMASLAPLATSGRMLLPARKVDWAIKFMAVVCFVRKSQRPQLNTNNLMSKSSLPRARNCLIFLVRMPVRAVGSRPAPRAALHACSRDSKMRVRMPQKTKP